MTDIPDESNTHALLRRRAEVRISGGIAPASQRWTIGSASLTLLHRLASDPATAGDALKLLHELQVHQVELDLQYEHMDEERHDVQQSVNRLADLFVFAPVAYFKVNGAGHAIEANVLAGRMLGVAHNDVYGCNIGQLVAPDGQGAVVALLKQVLASGTRHSCTVQAASAAHRLLELVASRAPDGQHCLLVVLEVGSAAF